ncbi:MAG: DNA polymerase III subunit delta [Candidatus Kapaibacterium sp.]|nr:MAG: DNA polymerase III subunit delta [Candidatus Kapabacteria bacterium]
MVNCVLVSIIIIIILSSPKRFMLESVTALVKSRTFPPVLLMFGEEDFLLEEAYNTLVEAAVERNGMESFNVDVIDGSDISQETLVEMASAYPMMSERRVVAVRHFDKMSGVGISSGRSSSKTTSTKAGNAQTASAKAKETPEKKSPLSTYFRNPAPTTFLILQASADELNGLKAALKNQKQPEKAQKKLAAAKFPYNVLLEECEWIEFPKLYERELPSWVAERFKSLGRTIQPDACELLVAQSGESLRDLHNEIQKIITFAPDKRSLSREDIADVIGASKNYNIFELQRMIGERKLSKALEISQRMLTADKQELLIITMLTRYFTILWKLSEIIHQTQNHFELAKALDISAYFVPEYLGVLKNYTRSQIESAFYALCDADVSIKSSTVEDADVVIQKMLTRLITA